MTALLLAVVVLCILLAWALECAAGFATLRSLQPRVPEPFQGIFDPYRYRESQRYIRENTWFDLMAETMSVVAVLTFILLGGFPALDTAARWFGFGPVLTGLIFFALLGLLADVASTPFALYKTFIIEERYGFNKTTLSTYVKDKLKGLGLSAAIGGPLLALVLYFFGETGGWGWFWAWLAVVVVMLVVQFVAPVWILPLFNTFTPLEDGPLRRRLERYAASQGLQLSGIYVVDGSRRSAKANAFLAGFGKTKRIGLFDTLLAEHDNAEIEAVLAHEVGHHKRGHILKGMALAIVRTFVLFWLLSLVLQWEALHAAFGMPEATVYGGFVFFGLLFIPVSLLLGIGFNAMSRKFEYEADGFAAQTGPGPEPMVRALQRLAQTNYANLTPARLNVVLHYSHPPIIERIRALDPSGAEPSS